MNDNIRFSIIIPHYQSFDTLDKNLQAIPVCSSIQVIVVDDNSPEKNRLNDLKQKFHSFLFIELKKNGGAGKARNEGLKVAKGKWLLFADADDYFVSDAFCCFMDNYDNDADIIFFKSQSWDVISNQASDRHIKLNQFVDDFTAQRIGSEDNLRYRWHCPWSKMIRKSLIDKNSIKFDETQYANDAMFSIQAGYFAKSVSVENRVVYCVTASPHSLTRKVDYASIMGRFHVLAACNNFLKSVGEKKNQAVVLRYYVIAMRYEPRCIVSMIRYGIKNNVSIFAGLNKWFEVFKCKTKFSNF